MRSNIKHADFVLIGGGIMSATMGILLLEKFPSKQVLMIERLPKVAEESSEAWNNAGTGHSGYCELNYTEEVDGKMEITKAVKIAEQFQESLNFWNHAYKKGYLQDLSKCLHTVPHCSFVVGSENVDFLQKRWEAMRAIKFFETMQFSTDREILKQWFPLMMEGRPETELVAGTRIENGYDVNFGEITDQLVAYLVKQNNFRLILDHEVTDVDREDERWLLEVNEIPKGDKFKILSNYVFIGAGGGALPLLEKSKIKEIKGYGGFPISGMWLRCTNQNIIDRHDAKVYGKAKEGSPPMSVPHLDSRFIEGKKELLFGPFAGFSTKFLKNGSIWDLPLSVDFHNLSSLLGAGYHNLPLVSYLIKQVAQDMNERIDDLREFYPEADGRDWELVHAGQRVQIIKPDDEDHGKLEFGTEVIVSKDHTLSALLGASPGASTSYSIMKNILEKGFGQSNSVN